MCWHQQEHGCVLMKPTQRADLERKGRCDDRKKDILKNNLSVEGQPVRTAISGIGFDHQTWLEIISTRA